VLPDKISLYKRNIEAISSDREQIYRQIRKTLLHEIGHHFSLTDRDLRRMGW
jgi:predicted Zn-dependent protease with MMP-like domain